MMVNAIDAQRFNGMHAAGGDISKPNPVLDMDGSTPTRLQGSEQFRRQEIHLPEKPRIGFVVPEIVITGAVLVMIAEWD